MRLLDLFCGAGGAAWGYHLAGFQVTGIDIHPQPNYPFKFIHADALTFPLGGFDVIHASPPCQRYSYMSHARPGLALEYPDYIDPIRRRLIENAKPYIIENVEGAPLIQPILLCGAMFGLETYRHRLFESNIPLGIPRHLKHVVPSAKAGTWRPGTYMSIVGKFGPVARAKQVMGIHWMKAAELAEAIPPIYTHYLGQEIIHYIRTNFRPPRSQTDFLPVQFSELRLAIDKEIQAHLALPPRD